jgi:hypothetical protein
VDRLDRFDTGNSLPSLAHARRLPGLGLRVSCSHHVMTFLLFYFGLRKKLTCQPNRGRGAVAS